MVELNHFIFEDTVIEKDFRNLLKDVFYDDAVNSLFKNEINLIPMDFDLKKKIDLPAVAVNVFQSRAINADDMELQAYVPFTVEVEVYTEGVNRISKNRQLCNAIIAKLQTNTQMENFYNRGLRLEENREIGSLTDSVYRRVIRMSGLCDNNQKILKARR